MLPATFETIITRLERDGVLFVTFNRPNARNATNTQLAREMLEIWKYVATHREVRCVVLTGAGDKAFSAGGDLKERQGMSAQQWEVQHSLFRENRRALRDCQVPVIAAVNGYAYGGGCETVLACDFAYAIRSARFALTEVTLGIMPGSGGTQFLPRTVGEPRAMEIILTGRPFDAEEALSWGMINRICENLDELMREVHATAKLIADNAPLSIRQAKKAIRGGLQMDIQSALLLENEAYRHLVDTEDRKEGVRAFAEKRRPNFTGR